MFNNDTKKKVDINTRHIDENAKNIENNAKMIHILYSIIILLMVIIAGLAFWLGGKFSWTVLNDRNSENNQSILTTNVNQDTNNMEDLRTGRWIEITIIGDERCNNCVTEELSEQIKGLPFLSNAVFIEKDFSDTSAQDILERNNIRFLPVVLFNDNNLWDGGQISPYLEETIDWSYKLQIWEAASFDPYAERSERGFLELDEDTLNMVQEWLYPKWPSDAEILWIEYSDFWCGACQQFHSSGIIQSAFDNYADIMSKATVWFLTVGWPTSQNAMQAIECMWEQNSNLYHDAWTHFYTTNSYNQNELDAFAENAWINMSAYNECSAWSEVQTKMQNQINIARELFGVSWTPWNIVINLETGEYTSAGWDIENAIESLKL